MELKSRTIFCALLAAMFIGNGCGRKVFQNDTSTTEISGNTQQIIIKRKITSNLSSSVAIESQNRVKTVKPLGIEVVKVPAGKTSDNYIKELSKDSSIEYAEPDYIRTIYLSPENFTNNSVFSLIDYLKNTSPAFSSVRVQNIFNDPDIKLQYGLEKVNAEKAWGITPGNENVVVAVVDTGVDLNHPDLEKNLMNGYTTVKGTIDPNDDNGHGTHVAGIVAAISNNGKGGSGLAPRCKIMPVKALSGKGEGTDSDIAEAVVWAVDHGANIINLSLGGNGSGKTLENAMKYAYNSNVLVVAAMGNNGKNIVTYPAGYKNIIAVGATDSKDKIAPFSNFGEWISVAAPGLKIYSTFPSYKVELSRYNLPSNYAVLSGTSMAVPFVSALSALIMSRNPGINRADVRKRIESSCRDVDQPGFDENSGFGIIDAYKSLTTR